MKPALQKSLGCEGGKKKKLPSEEISKNCTMLREKKKKKSFLPSNTDCLVTSQGEHSLTLFFLAINLQ